MYKAYDKMNKKEAKELDKWRVDMSRKFAEFQKENECVILPASQQAGTSPDLVQLGFIIYTPDERKAMLPPEEEPKPANKIIT